MKNFNGRVWNLGDNISTDLLMPSISMYGKVPLDKMKYYCLQNIRPEFSSQVKEGDIIVAGKNFGCGSSRSATSNLMQLGISCVVSESCSAIFFRNSISLGFPIILCEGICEIFEDGDMAEVRVSEGIIVNLVSGQTKKAEAYPPFLQRVIDMGGMIELFRKNITLNELNA